jgi:iron complex transport system ATP-binding protein
MISVENISYSYSGGRDILKNVSFDAHFGECVGILGNNGVGKSTLITCLCKIRTPKSGTVCINRRDIHKMKRLEAARLISYVAQKKRNQPHDRFRFGFAWQEAVHKAVGFASGFGSLQTYY